MRRMALALLILLSGSVHAAPDPALTPGDTIKVTVDELCCTGYSKRVRRVSNARKRRVYAKYNIKPEDRKNYVIDHLISLELGGSNSVSNLWPEPIKDAKKKDVMENRLKRKVCSGDITLEEAQKQIAEFYAVPK